MSWNVPNDKSNYRVVSQMHFLEVSSWYFLRLLIYLLTIFAFQRQNYLTLLSGSYTDGKVQCTVMLSSPIIVVEGKTFDLANNKYILLVASGSSITRKLYSH